MRVLVVTIVHHPLDARIFSRQIRALLDAGHKVAYAAPWRACGVTPPGELRAIDLPRAAGRDRLKAVMQARRVIKRAVRSIDTIILHDPELLAAIAGVRRPTTIWDVHEDTVAALADKRWLPSPARPIARAAVRLAEHIAERRVKLMLAEARYQDRFRHAHPVVPNDVRVPSQTVEAGDGRVVYLGRISRGRGAEELVQLASMLDAGVTLELIGPCDRDVESMVTGAHESGMLDWRGFMRNEEALGRIDGALAGLSLLRDEPNYRHSRPTKVIEYMARGVPVITTPNPAAERIVRRHACGFVVPFGDPAAAAKAVTDLRSDEQQRHAMAGRGHAAALTEFDWSVSGPDFVRQLEEWVAQDRVYKRA